MRRPGSLRTRRFLLVLHEGVKNQVPDSLLRRGVDDRPEQREAAPLAVDCVLPGRKRDIPAATAATVPDAEPKLLESFERTVGEMDLSIGELAGRVAPVVWRDLDRENGGNLFCTSADVRPDGKAPRYNGGQPA
jgi:hypothetical protein